MWYKKWRCFLLDFCISFWKRRILDIFGTSWKNLTYFNHKGQDNQQNCLALSALNFRSQKNTATNCRKNFIIGFFQKSRFFKNSRYKSRTCSRGPTSKRTSESCFSHPKTLRYSISYCQIDRLQNLSKKNTCGAYWKQKHAQSRTSWSKPWKRVWWKRGTQSHKITLTERWMTFPSAWRSVLMPEEDILKINS